MLICNWTQLNKIAVPINIPDIAELLMKQMWLFIYREKPLKFSLNASIDWIERFLWPLWFKSIAKLDVQKHCGNIGLCVIKLAYDNNILIIMLLYLQLLDTLPVCQDFNRQGCTRPTCRFVHIREGKSHEFITFFNTILLLHGRRNINRSYTIIWQMFY